MKQILLDITKAIVEDPDSVSVSEKAKKWISNGAQPTETVRSLLKKSGVLD